MTFKEEIYLFIFLAYRNKFLEFIQDVFCFVFLFDWIVTHLKRDSQHVLIVYVESN